jgi:hypothetical protein
MHNDSLLSPLVIHDAPGAATTNRIRINTLAVGMGSSRLLMSQTGMCGVMPLPITQMEEFASAVRCVSGEPIGLEPQSLVRPLDHCLCRSDLVISTGRRGLHIDDNSVLDVDQVIEPIAELDALVGLRGLGRIAPSCGRSP